MTERKLKEGSVFNWENGSKMMQASYLEDEQAKEYTKRPFILELNNKTMLFRDFEGLKKKANKLIEQYKLTY